MKLREEEIGMIKGMDDRWRKMRKRGRGREGGREERKRCRGTEVAPDDCWGSFRSVRRGGAGNGGARGQVTARKVRSVRTIPSVL